jgi:hypothetical protein
MRLSTFSGLPGDDQGVLRGDVHRDVPGERLELLGPRNEVGLAVDLDEHGELGPRMYVGHHKPVACRTVGLLGGLEHAALPQVFDRFLDVAAGRGQCGLAVHHACAGLVPELHDLGSGDLHGAPSA